MEQALVHWHEDTWSSADDDLWYGSIAEDDPDGFHRARNAAVLKHEGVVLSTCWAPLRGIVATVKCSDGYIRNVAVEHLRAVK